MLLIQQLIELHLEARPDPPGHYRGICEDMIRAALPARAYHQQPPHYPHQQQQPNSRDPRGRGGGRR